MNQTSRTSRLISLDVFRGLTIALMIIVNSPGNQSPYHWLEHSLWNGCTLADLVFPFFIVIVGISSVLALSNLRLKGVATDQIVKKIFRRSVYIFMTGLLLNAFPNHFDIESIRIPGVLQRIAICYLASSLIFIMMQTRGQIIITISLLVGYGCLMVFNPAMMQDGNSIGYPDRLIFGAKHLYSPVFDPEGLLSTIPAIASALLGNLIGILLITSYSKQLKCIYLGVAGVSLLLLGWYLSDVLPLNKSLWSSTYVLWTGGLALLVYALIYAIIEIKGWLRWSAPFDLFGRHSMLAYVLHVLFLKIQAMVHIPNADGVIISARIYMTQALFGGFSLENAALLYSVSYMVLWLFVLKTVETSRHRISMFQTSRV